MDTVTSCPACTFALSPEWYYCPNCGKAIREAPLVISIPKQILIYLVSFFLSPLGLKWGIPYVKYKNRKIKTIGIIVIILTVASIILTISTLKYALDQYSVILNSLSTGLQ